MPPQIDYLAQQGEELSFRLGYDDINESLTHPDIVRRTLLALGATKAQLKAGQAHAAYQGITRLGLPPPQHEHDAEAGSAGDDADAGAAAAAGDFDVERAGAFWSEKVFVKTYQERRRCAEACCLGVADSLLCFSSGPAVSSSIQTAA